MEKVKKINEKMQKKNTCLVPNLVCIMFFLPYQANDTLFKRN